MSSGMIPVAGLGQKITDNFGEAKLLDDIIDHWDAGMPHAHSQPGWLQSLLEVFFLLLLLRVCFFLHVAAYGIDVLVSCWHFCD